MRNASNNSVWLLSILLACKSDISMFKSLEKDIASLFLSYLIPRISLNLYRKIRFKEHFCLYSLLYFYTMTVVFITKSIARHLNSSNKQHNLLLF